MKGFLNKAPKKEKELNGLCIDMESCEGTKCREEMEKKVEAAKKEIQGTVEKAAAE